MSLCLDPAPREQRDLVDEVVILLVEDAELTHRRAALLDDPDWQLVEFLVGE
jgi:hypothetical protein